MIESNLKKQNDMRIVLANIALLFGAVGFAGYLFLIISSALGCCAGLTTANYENVVTLILFISVVIFGLCMYNNCCKISKKGQ